MRFFGDDPRQSGGSWFGNNYPNQGNYNGGQFGPPYGNQYGPNGLIRPTQGKTTLADIGILTLGLAFLGVVVYFAPKVLVLSIVLIVFNLVFRQSKRKLLSRDYSPGFFLQTFAFAVTAITIYCVIMLMTYPHPFWTNALAVYGIMSLVTDVFYRLVFDRSRDDDRHESVRVFGVPLTSNQWFFVDIIHIGGHFSLLVFYMLVVMTWLHT